MKSCTFYPFLMRSREVVSLGNPTNGTFVGYPNLRAMRSVPKRGSVRVGRSNQAFCNESSTRRYRIFDTDLIPRRSEAFDNLWRCDDF